MPLLGAGTIELDVETATGSKMSDDRNWLVDHTGIAVSEIHGSARFYEAALRPLG
jgi:hypothetical protein